jgi:cell wall-associated NlpC family hydrolase
VSTPLISPTARARSSISPGTAPTYSALGAKYAPPVVGSNNLGGRGSATYSATQAYLDRQKQRTQQNQFSTDQFVQTQRQHQDQLRQQANASVGGGGGGSPDFSGAGGKGNYDGPMPNFYDAKTTSGLRQNIVKSAYSRLGTPYAWGGGGYNSYAGRGHGHGTNNVVGVDCSGLVSWTLGRYGIKGPRQSDAMLRTMGYKTAVRNARPGDLIGWQKGGHVAIYAGNGWLIESPKPGGRVRYRRVPPGTYAVHLSLPGD